jgi:hypothetical protein
MRTHRSRESLRRIGAAAAFCVVGVAAALGQGGPRLDVEKAAHVKAASLRYLAEFTTWPSYVFSTNNSPIVIGTVGHDDQRVAAILEEAAQRKALPAAQQRPVELRRFARVPPPSLARLAPPQREAAAADTDRLRQCHILFVTSSEQSRLAHLQNVLHGYPIITVSDIEGFADAQGMIEFKFSAATRRIHLRINLRKVRGAGLQLSSKVLALRGVEIIE